MKIICTVKEFGQLVRGCEKRSCYQCPLEEVCGDHPEGCGIEQFIEADNVVDEFAPKRRPDFLDKVLNVAGSEAGGVSDG